MDRVRTARTPNHASNVVEYGKMPKKSFIALFTGNESSEAWLDEVLALQTSHTQKDQT
ncbi:hypothetical protein O9929_02115 [Vibrio lentus]|nr:hypothetical protein [Vibrio lentus]